VGNRLAVLSDIHGNLLALEAVLKDLEQLGGADKIWILGDLVAFGPRPVECLDKITALKDTKVISGNTDRYLVTGQRPHIDPPKDESEWQAIQKMLNERDANFNWTVSKLSFANYESLAKLGHNLEYEISGYGWAVGYHGAPGNDEGFITPEMPDHDVLDQLLDREGRLAFGGHLHVAMDRTIGRWRVVNVGSVGMPNDHIRATYAMVSFDENMLKIDLRRVDYDVEAVIRDLQQSGNPSWEWVATQIKAPLNKPTPQGAS
jgi:predicted phosphodiesterase